MRKHWYLIIGGGVLAVVVAVMAISFYGVTGTSPAAYVAKHYSPAAQSLARADARTFTSPKQPTEVTADIANRWKPISQYADGSGVYLRYAEDAVVVQPRGTGSLIMVMDARRAYHAFYGFVGGGWGWSSPQGESFRGRGPGTGK